MATSRLTRSDILRLFELLDQELAAEEVQGELAWRAEFPSTDQR